MSIIKLSTILPDVLLIKTYSFSLVIASVIIAIISAFTAFGIAERAYSASKENQKLIWIIFGATTMGIGIWAMHFIGMIALSLPIPVTYDTFTTVISIVPAILACSVVFLMIRDESITHNRLLLGGLILGSGIGFMHYVGMSAMRLNAIIIHDTFLFYLSLLIAVVLATFALKINHQNITEKNYKLINKRQMLGAIVMGGSVSATHYTAMMAVSFTPKDMGETFIGMEHSSLSLLVAGVVMTIVLFALLIPALSRYKEVASRLEQLSVRDTQHLLAILSSSPDALIQINQTGEIIGWNKQAEKLFGWSYEEVIDQSLDKNIIPSRFRDAHIQGLRHFLSTGESSIHNKVIEIEALHKNGYEFPVELKVLPIKSQDRYEFTAFIRDISERKAFEKKQQEMSKQLSIKAEEIKFQQRALDQHAIVSITDKKGNIIYVNDKFIEISQYAKDELMGANHRKIKSGFHSESFFKDMWKTIAGGEVWHGQIKNRAKDGSIYWVASTIVPHFNAQGKPEQYISMRTDITPLKELEIKQQQAHDKLLKSEQYNRALLDNSDIGLALCTMEGQFEYLNPAFTHIIGHSVEEVKALSYWKITPEKYFDAEQEQLALLKQTGHYGPYEKEYIHKDGHLVPVRLQGTLIEKDGKVLIWSSIEDITKDKEQQKAVEVAKQQAEKANKAKSEFLSLMSHELRTPLNAILGFSQLLMFDEDEPLTPEQKENTEQIMQGGEHLLQLINEVLDLAKIEAGKADISFETISVNQLFNETLMLVQPVIDKYNVHIDSICCCEQAKDLKIHADYLRTKQVLLNLLSNAAKYNKKEGVIEIKCSEVSMDMLRITVSDNGNGISIGKQKELFKPFSRLGAENSNIEGSGIGLVVCKELIEKMHGKMGFESEMGKGSSFWFELPLSTHAVAEVSGGNKEDDQEQVFPEINGTLLYVEDNPANLKLMETLILRAKGLSLITATTAEEGLYLAEDKQPDIIIMDINLPGMSGVEAVKHLKNNPKTSNIPVLALSAAATMDDISINMDVGFEQYLTKPIDVSKILNCIYSILKN